MNNEEQEMESAIQAIFDNNKEAFDNVMYNLNVVGSATVIRKDGKIECERVVIGTDCDICKDEAK